MLKVAIVGCGKIADDHASQIRRIDGCEIVGVCDKEPLMARQLAEKFPIKRLFRQLAGTVEGNPARRRAHHDAAGKPFQSCQALSRIGMPCLRREAVHPL